MTVLYITEQGATVSLRDGRAVVRKDGNVIQEVPAFKLDQVVTFGNVHLTTPLIAFCLAQGVEVAFLSSKGKYRGRLQPEFTKSAILRQQQYTRALDPNFRLVLARAIVTGKTYNMMAMLRRQRRLREGGQAALNDLERSLTNVTAAPSVASLYGYEGTATATYYRVFRAALIADWGFEARNHHPPRDPVNVLLSLGYTLLYNLTLASINVVGLDPYMGYFHMPRHGHAALASDLMEEHRSVLVDPLVLTALNKRIIGERDFRGEDSGQMRLSPSALRQFLRLFANRLQEKVYYAHRDIHVGYSQVIELQARRLARVLMNEEAAYVSYRVDEARG